MQLGARHEPAHLRYTPFMLRYAVLRHDGVDRPHFDLLFETAPGSGLATWRSETWPIDEVTPLLRLKDHRRLYLDYEGPVAGDRGWVLRVAEGTCRIEPDGQTWTIHLENLRHTLLLRQVRDEAWEAKPLRDGPGITCR